MAKISIHRALTEIKTITKRLNSEINDSKLIEFKIGKADKVNGVSIDTIEKNILATYDKITALINRYRTLKYAIILSNAGVRNPDELVRSFSFNNYSWTVAETIEYKNSISFEEDLLSVMISQLELAQENIEDHNFKTEKRCDEYIRSMFGGDFKKMLTAEEVATHSKLFKDNNDATLINPLNLQKKINELKEKLDCFKTEVDSFLSENNASTFIDVE